MSQRLSPAAQGCVVWHGKIYQEYNGADQLFGLP